MDDLDIVTLREEWTFHGGATCKRYLGAELLDTQHFDHSPIIYINRTNDLTAAEAKRLRGEAGA